MSSIIQTMRHSSHLDPSENVIFQRHLIIYRVSKLIKTVLEIGSGEGYGVYEAFKERLKNILT